MLVSATLQLRRDHPELFGRYVALHRARSASTHVVAFDRGGAVTLATRLPLGLAAAGGWRDTGFDLPAGSYTDLLTGRRLESTGGTASGR